MTVAKQEAFEEKIRLKNQFRSLDEDEVEFLDSLLESTRAQEANIQKETAEQLEVFRQQREQAERILLEGSATENGLPAEEEDWKIPARKRRREKSNKELLLPGKKRQVSVKETVDSTPPQKQRPETSSKPNLQSERKTESTPGSGSDSAPPPTGGKVEPPPADVSKKKPAEKPLPEKKPVERVTSAALGLAGYSSDSE